MVYCNAISTPFQDLPVKRIPVAAKT